MTKSVFEKGFSYDDVLLAPKFSSIKSRRDVGLETNLSKNLRLNIPLISANMDTVTESGMAIAMARLGGIGVVHRFMTIDRQAEEVDKVKRFTNYIIETPYTISPESTIADYKELSQKFGVSGFPVIDKSGYLVGMATERDIVFENNLGKKIKVIMTPREKLITATKDIAFSKAEEVFKKFKIEKLPLVDKSGKLCGLIAAKDIQKTTLYPRAAKDKKGRLLVGAAVGVADDYLERAWRLIKAEADILIIDIAHGHSVLAVEALKAIKKKFAGQEVIAGNVATESGVKDLIRAGADGIKVGVGPGSACTTRVITGAGVPQLTAVLNCARAAQKYKIPIIADGGIRKPADITKALAAGASTVMIGNLFAGTDEAPGRITNKEGKRYKLYRGMASFGANVSRRSLDTSDEDKIFDNLMLEGTEGLVPYRGSAKDVIEYLVAGLRSGMSYLNAKRVIDISRNAKFIEITANALQESHPHDLEKA
ncbi:MAG: IMP dehydrogenase [Candidatus Portnoybacteria bacterium CG_4_8_14_3_um_filter_44_10]|uniref:Inosine-5'-monophosphate dehydrogenase n=5 Tax=Candidatus Portnoyibacteriota TaxID=1817913 RepID=A0A2H0KP49_9BACT|nr:MAG: IMP dehydrogenase [Parcubacteria group bacterium CG2_30_44_18]PIQ73930.1 MAG: IMP dehydrogenase [Candidatus Portnoybacteria bacterium CG11_big_fil_rev_8_21_14_0_20_44_10]PIS16915.1 MAG: IMP dehydrogenase [Candidatus Portnoybacteria bacterium CG09_land_8_20_14_0_10_44_13]PIW75170.1 MAG: IMP dehydrogenase [Candidatus Portnoybacteria bacterium CG_4_8_14_3_um_filter_44_10]PIZ71395.1 MAG: IMP dehydrogenase [Candidatus Portnoybacteria bacterium CG_4_10_14_0_2_um_filter_44_20]PJA63403.1 MAG: 